LALHRGQLLPLLLHLRAVAELVFMQKGLLFLLHHLS